MQNPRESTRQQNSAKLEELRTSYGFFTGVKVRSEDAGFMTADGFPITLDCGKGPACTAGPGKFYEMCPAVVGWQRGFWERDLNARSAVPRPIPSCLAISFHDRPWARSPATCRGALGSAIQNFWLIIIWNGTLRASIIFWSHHRRAT